MIEARDVKLAKQLLSYSVEAKSGETLYLEIKGLEALSLGKALIAEASKLGVTPFWYYNDESLLRQALKHGTKEQFERQAELHSELMTQSDMYIGVRGSDNPFDLADINVETKELYNNHFYKPVHFEKRVKNTRWVVLRYPNNTMASMAERSQEDFADFYYRVCLLNYKKMKKGLDALATIMNAAKDVHIVAPNTDLKFSIEDIPAIPCDGKLNIPDGEVFTAPVRESVNGSIQYNVPSIFRGILFNDISFVFENGKIVQASTTSDQKELDQILDSDEGARYLGEFAIGVNPCIREPLRDILFDEKIAGSFHLTPGQCYEIASNGNESSVHWDLVQIQRAEYGGGEIWFDGNLLRKDGIFVDNGLEKLFSEEYLTAA